MNRILSIQSACLSLCLLATLGFAFVRVQAEEPGEERFYRITSFEAPEGSVLEAGAFQLMSDGRLAVATRRGEIWMITEPFSPSVKAANFSRFAHGLHEPLGLAERDGWLYVTQRSDVSRLQDTDHDGLADIFEIVGDGWEISGDYHEYAFGSKFDREGKLWVVTCLTGSFGSAVPYRGWCLRVSADGQTIPTAYGIRSPGGIGFNAEGEVFYTDNQGPWNGTCGLKHLVPGKFAGHPGGNRWAEQSAEFHGISVVTPQDNSRMHVEAAKHPDLVPTAVYFPYDKMGKSASGIICDLSRGKFGPFENQLFVGDQSHSTLMRVDLEKIDGVYQGACFPFRSGFQSGVVGLEITPQGAVFVGGTNRGWGSRGPRNFSIERLDWTGEVPFEIQHMRLLKDGFRLSFTRAIDPATAVDPASFAIQTYTYIYREQYGSPEVDPTQPSIRSLKVAEDRMSLDLILDGLQVGHVHEVQAQGLRSATGEPLLHPQAYYTLNRLIP